MANLDRLRVLVTGAGGMAGRALTRELAVRHQARALTHQQLDVTDAAAVEKAVADYRPHLIAHLAAWTDVDGCELDPAKAQRVNGQGTQNVVDSARRHHARVLYVSTDYVFDGTANSPIQEDAPVNPINEYGRSKLAGEKAVQTLTEYFIVRTSWVFGVGGKNFVDTVARVAFEKDSIEMVEDQLGCPTYAPDLAEALVKILETRSYGIYHVTNDTECTWYMLAQEILKRVGSDARLTPISSEQLSRPARRPRYSVLANFRLHHLLGFRMRPWREALADHLEQAVAS